MKLSRLVLWLLPAALVVITGCTRLPAAEFSAYRQSFAAARTAGEEVLLDYGAALQEAQAVKVEQARAEGAAADTDRPRWNRTAILSEVRAADPVAVRMQAWAVVAAYNDALTGLAEGKSAEELGTAFDGLTGSLESFPWAALGEKAAGIAASAGGLIGPAVAIIKDLVVEAKREADRRRFIEAVNHGAPLIHGLIELLLEDADDFSSVRYGLYDRAYAKTIVRRAGTFARSAGQIVRAGGQPDEDSPAVETIKNINAALHRIREYRDGHFDLRPTDGGNAYSDEMLRELTAISLSITELADRAATLDARMDAYEAVLTDYVRLLAALDNSLESLRIAAANVPRELPDTAELAVLVVRVRRAMATYELAR